MPLNSKASVGANVAEFHGGSTYQKTKAKFGKKKADKQAVAVAFATKKKGKAKPMSTAQQLMQRGPG